MNKRTVALAGILSLILTSGTYAYTAANTVPASKAGVGSAAITGYTVSAVDYGLNSTDPTNIDQVAFTLDSAPVAGSTIKVKLEAAGTSFYNCTNVATAVTCNTTSPQATVLAADQLQVIVAQ